LDLSDQARDIHGVQRFHSLRRYCPVFVVGLVTVMGLAEAVVSQTNIAETPR